MHQQLGPAERPARPGWPPPPRCPSAPRSGWHRAASRWSASRPGWPAPTTGCSSGRGRGRAGPRRWPPPPRRPTVPGPGRAPRSASVRATSGKSPSKHTTRPTRPRARVVERRQPVAGGEHGGLERRRVEVGLAVPRHQLAARVEDEGGVVDAGRRRPSSGTLPAASHMSRRRAACAEALAERGPSQGLGVRPGVRGPGSRGRSRTTTARAAPGARRPATAASSIMPSATFMFSRGSPGAASHWATPTRRSRFTSATWFPDLSYCAVALTLRRQRSRSVSRNVNALLQDRRPQRPAASVGQAGPARP